MKHYEKMRDRLRSGEERFAHLNATQLVKHAFGLVTEGRRRERAAGLFYLFAEPAARNGHAIATDELARHRDEITRFAEAVAGDEVSFASASYREWLGTWGKLDADVSAHGRRILDELAP
jgi:hypothetical protein